MAAFKKNLRIDQGSTFSDTVTWKTGTPAAAVDLTGCSAKLQMRASIPAATVLIELTSVGGGIVLGGVAGTIEIKMTAAATAALTWTRAVYDLEITFADGTVRRLLAGDVTVSPEVTR